MMANTRPETKDPSGQPPSPAGFVAAFRAQSAVFSSGETETICPTPAEQSDDVVITI